MKFKGFQAEGSNEIVATAYLDGHYVEDRILEGVIFKIKVLPSGELNVNFAKPNDPSLDGLDKQYWINYVKDSIENFELEPTFSCNEKVHRNNKLLSLE